MLGEMVMRDDSTQERGKERWSEIGVKVDEEAESM